MKNKVWNYIIAGLCIAFGIVFLVNPTESLYNIVYYIGLIMLIIGIINIISCIVNKESILLPGSKLFSGVFNIIFGIVLMNNKEGTAKIIPIILGIWLILSATSSLGIIFNNKKRGNKIDNKLLITYIVKLIIGIIILTTPVITIILTSWVLGLILIAIGVYFIINSVNNNNKSVYKVKVK